LIHAPGPREAIEDVATTRNILLATVYRNVQGSAVAYRFEGGRWVPSELALPEHASLHIVDTDEREDRAFIDVAGFLIPNALWLVEPGSGAVTPLKSLPARFDATELTVEQFEAVSSDATAVPYFVIRPTALAFDASAPTL